MKIVEKRTAIREILSSDRVDYEIVVKGWIRSIRKSKAFSFIVINDGTSQQALQIIADEKLENYESFSSLLMGSAIAVKGKIVASGGKGQSVEMHALQVEVIGKTDENYPFQKKFSTLEFLREHAHLRSRTNVFGAVFRVRHALTVATHSFFNERGFYSVTTPIITGQDAEGAGEMFKVTTMDLAQIPQDDKGEVDFKRDYFGSETGLAVTGQLEAECMALGLGSVYTFGPAFRAENSNTPRHLSELWMVEPEVAFADLDEVAELATDYLKYLISYVLKNCPEEMKFLADKKKRDKEDNDHIGTLTHVRDSKFVKITYTEAMEILSKSKKKFEFPTNWGDELQTEHERYLAEEHFKLPVIVTDYPKDFKAFYMKQNDDGKTVRAMDVLVPGVGEIIGGSQREDDHGKLVRRIKELDMNEEDYWWYLELRKFGSVPHSGFGLGFERAVMYITGMSNIRDAIPFPRTPRNARF
jgi:asparaginyl-tRNA synthetase